MHFALYYSIIFIGVTFGFDNPSCLLTLQFIFEYAVERSWDQLVFFDGLYPDDCIMEYIKLVMQCLSENGIKLMIQSAINPDLPDALSIQRHRVSAIVFLDSFNLTLNNNVLSLVMFLVRNVKLVLYDFNASQKSLFNYYISWLLITINVPISIVDAVIKDLSIGIDSDVTVATTFLNDKQTYEIIRHNRHKFCPKFGKRVLNYKYNLYLDQDQNKNDAVKLGYIKSELNKTVAFYLTHVYKIRVNDNSSFVTDFLGYWNPSAYKLHNPTSVKLRTNFYGFPLKIGLYNGSIETNLDHNNNEKLYDNVKPMLKFMEDIARMLNATPEISQHEKLGSLTNKAWTDLFHDVVANNVDIGVGYITTTEERQEYMSFSFSVVKYMRNIYFVPPSSGKTRNIFLQPFSSELLVCVVITYFVIIATMEVITFVAKITNQDEDKSHAGLGEATLWCISIMCMQGSPWTPVSRSGKAVLLVGLFFALVTYNSYSGFITSILSVQNHAIRTIDDLKQFHFKIGYDTDDEEFIRTTNDSNLRDIYISVYNSRESGLIAVEGLLKVLNGSYGFFVSASLARHFLKTTLIQEQCLMRELKLAQTESEVAFPMSKTCPYQKIINLSLLRTREFGILSRVGQELLPDMPRCVNPSMFNTARISDVYWAFYILLFGLVTSITIWMLERAWKKRIVMKEKLLQRIRYKRNSKRLNLRKVQTFHNDYDMYYGATRHEFLN